MAHNIDQLTAPPLFPDTLTLFIIIIFIPAALYIFDDVFTSNIMIFSHYSIISNLLISRPNLDRPARIQMSLVFESLYISGFNKSFAGLSNNSKKISKLPTLSNERHPMKVSRKLPKRNLKYSWNIMNFRIFFHYSRNGNSSQHIIL